MTERTVDAASGPSGPDARVSRKLHTRRSGPWAESMTAWLLTTPFLIILSVFLLVPIALIVVVSFWQTTSFSYEPAFVLENYGYLLGSSVTLNVYLKTLFYTATVWAVTLVVGFTVAWFLVFHVHSLSMQITLFMVCTIPFWTSNIIRMISWIPFLGRNGIANSTLLELGLIDAPLEWLLFSDFAVILAFVHLYTLFMIVPIFNTMMRIDHSLIEAARDAGASGVQIFRHVVLPLSMPGIMIGTIFVVTLVMGDFITVRFMSGGQSASVGRTIANEVGLLQYPAASANAVILLITVLLMVGVLLRFVDIRKEL